VFVFGNQTIDNAKTIEISEGDKKLILQELSAIFSIDEKLSDKTLIAQALSTKIIDTPQKDKRHFLKIADLTAQTSTA
jgi:hypothetical protein